MITKLSKIESKILRFVQRATSKDEYREVLTGIFVNGATVSADGYRIHAVESESIPTLDELLPDGGLVRIATMKRGENYIEPQELKDKFPNYNAIIDEKKDITTDMFFNPEFVVDALRDLDKGEPTRIRMFGKMQPFEIYGTIDGRPCYALIMPMTNPDNGHNRALDWRPVASGA